MMKFPINLRLLTAVVLLFAGLTLLSCTAQVTECPKSLKVVINDGSHHLSWESVDDATDYRIYRRISGSSDFKFVTDTKATDYTDLPSVSGSYDYQVTAIGPNGESAAAVFLASTAPEEPVSLSAPQITYIMNTLHDRGFNVETDALTVEEAVGEIL